MKLKIFCILLVHSASAGLLQQPPMPTGRQLEGFDYKLF